MAATNSRGLIPNLERKLSDTMHLKSGTLYGILKYPGSILSSKSALWNTVNNTLYNDHLWHAVYNGLYEDKGDVYNNMLPALFRSELFLSVQSKTKLVTHCHMRRLFWSMMTIISLLEAHWLSNAQLKTLIYWENKYAFKNDTNDVELFSIY